MEDSFRARVDKVFGSLASSSSNTSSSSSLASSSLSSSCLWSLTDEEIERREWKRERDSPDDSAPKPYPPNLDGFFSKNPNISSSSFSSSSQTQSSSTAFPEELEVVDLHDHNDNDKGKQSHGASSSRHLVKPDDHDDEEWDIRSSIGLDSTLDLEEEEDENDKVAIGSEKAGDHLYMRDINGYWTDINFYDELPSTFKDIKRDPRANHMAAKLRLKEDAEAAGKFDSLRVSDTGLHVANAQNYTLDEGVNLKSILKRKENQTDPKSQKRVRFDSGCKNDYEDNCSPEEATMSEASFLPQESSGVPDYIRNPSKYKHYTFDSTSDIDEESNQEACLEFLNQLRRPNSEESQPVETSVDLPKSITFTPKKKLGNAAMLKNGNELKQNHDDVGKESIPSKGWSIGIAAAGEEQESEVCAMEEDEAEKVATNNSSSRRQGRQYRIKAHIGLDEHYT
ncbi:hypothetical protein ACSBR2_022435 [Camellia fascicularis]